MFRAPSTQFLPHTAVPSPMLRSDWDWDRPLLDTTASAATTATAAELPMETGKL